MLIVRLLGTFTIIPTTLLLTTCFFVLLAAESIEARSLKMFGYFVAVLLCITAVLIFFVGVCAIVTGRNPLRLILSHVTRGEMPPPGPQGG